MPAAEVEALRRAAAVSGAESVSAYVAEAIRGRLARDLALDKLEQLIGGPPAEDGLAWARSALGVPADAGLQ